MSRRAEAISPERKMEREARYGQKPPVGDSLDEVFAVHRLLPAEIRQKSVRLAQLTLRHPCDLDPKHGVKVCEHPDHRRDNLDLAERLEAFGLVEIRGPKAHTRNGKTTFGRGTCPWCLRSQLVGVTGLILGHQRKGKGSGTCPGVGKEPKAAAEVPLADDPGAGKTAVDVTL